MLVRGLDASHDWLFGNGISSYRRTEFAVMQNIQTRLLCWIGDCFFDVTAGIDYRNLLGSKNKQSQLELDIRRIILQTRFVSELQELNVSLDNITRQLSCGYIAKTDFSQQEISDNVIISINA